MIKDFLFSKSLKEANEFIDSISDEILDKTRVASIEVLRNEIEDLKQYTPEEFKTYLKKKLSGGVPQ